jgi:hypothetical protein
MDERLRKRLTESPLNKFDFLNAPGTGARSNENGTPIMTSKNILSEMRDLLLEPKFL